MNTEQHKVFFQKETDMKHTARKRIIAIMSKNCCTFLLH